MKKSHLMIDEKKSFDDLMKKSHLMIDEKKSFDD